MVIIEALAVAACFGVQSFVLGMSGFRVHNQSHGPTPESLLTRPVHKKKIGKGPYIRSHPSKKAGGKDSNDVGHTLKL